MADTIFAKDTPEATRPREIRIDVSASETSKQDLSVARVPLRLPKVTPLVVRSTCLQSASF